MIGYVILNDSIDGLGDCLVECIVDCWCKSINFSFKDLFCELNDVDRYIYLWDYGFKEGYVYSDYFYKVN